MVRMDEKVASVGNVDSWTVARHVWEREAHEISRLVECVDREAFLSSVELIARRKGRIFTAGVGTSSAVARKIAHTLSCVEQPAFFLSPADAVHGALGSVQPGDVGVLVSKGGDTGEIAALLPALASKGIPIIAVTERPGSRLGRAARVVLRVEVEQEADEFSMLATASSIAVIALFDAISVALMRRTGFTKAQFALIHPGGAVGQRLGADLERRGES